MSDENLRENCNKLVVKHNKLIEFKGRMTTNELKLFSLIIADVREQQERQFEEYEIDISVLQETTKDKNFYNYIKDIALRLEDKRIVIDRLNEDNKKYFNTIRLINKPRYTEGNKNLTVDLDRDLIPYIIDLKREFTRYQIENILRLNSSYAVRIYELLKQYEKIGEREINIKDLRNYLGIEKEEYTRFDNFEARVLLPAKKETNKYTDLIIDYEKIKTGRKITSILFKINPKITTDAQYIKYLDENYNIAEIKTMSGLENEKLNSKQVMDLYEISVNKTDDENVNPFEYIKLNYLLMIEKKTVRNNFAYLKKALENDYALAIGQLKFDIEI